METNHSSPKTTRLPKRNLHPGDEVKLRLKRQAEQRGEAAKRETSNHGQREKHTA